MSAIVVTVSDTEVAASLERLRALESELQPFLQALGDDAVERIKRRFETSTAPDGTPWKPNAAATLNLLAARLGKTYRKKSGELNAKGAQRVAGKKPLIGESGDLRRQIVALAGPAELELRATTAYAAIQHFGGQAGRGLKVTIPARPFMPVQTGGTIYPSEQQQILADIDAFIEDHLR